MPFLCFRSPKDSWFQAAANDDADSVIRFAQKCKCLLDNRETDLQACIINGFAAIHYAAYFNSLSALEQLLQFESDQMTKFEVESPTKLMPSGSFMIASGSLALHVALIRGNWEAFKMIDAFYPSAIKMHDDLDRSILQLFCHFPSSAEIVENLNSNEVLQLLKQDENILPVVCRFKRVNQLKHLIELGRSNNYNAKNYILQSALRVYDHKTLLDFAEAKVDYQKLATTQEEMELTVKIVKQLLAFAVQYAADNGLDAQLAEFREHCKNAESFRDEREVIEDYLDFADLVQKL